MTVDVWVTGTVASGIAGLDTILQGGFVRDRLYLIEGVPGSGKSTLALQSLLDGVRRGESVPYITLSESAAELRGSAASHGCSVAGVDIHEVLPSGQILQPEEQYSIFHPGGEHAAPAERVAVESSFLADNIMLHYFEAGGAFCQAIAVYKKRGGAHQRTIRHFRIAAGGVEIGAMLTGFHGILTGTPRLADSKAPALAAVDG